MPSLKNSTGSPLSSPEWLEVHHGAKLKERAAFAKKLASRKPERIVDIGCGTGLWLDIIKNHASHNCELIGVDSDPLSVESAKKRFLGWKGFSSFIELNIEDRIDAIPDADMYLLFNVAPYIRDVEFLIRSLKEKLRDNGCVVIRQYDGSLIRVGPMPQRDRSMIDASVQSSVLSSQQFNHYDMDRVFELVHKAGFEKVLVDFETTYKTSPHEEDVFNYLVSTLHWNIKYSSKHASEALGKWIDMHLRDNPEPSYFVCTDLVAWLFHMAPSSSSES